MPEVQETDVTLYRRGGFLRQNLCGNVTWFVKTKKIFPSVGAQLFPFSPWRNIEVYLYCPKQHFYIKYDAAWIM